MPPIPIYIPLLFTVYLHISHSRMDISHLSDAKLQLPSHTKKANRNRTLPHSTSLGHPRLPYPLPPKCATSHTTATQSADIAGHASRAPAPRAWASRPALSSSTTASSSTSHLCISPHSSSVHGAIFVVFMIAIRFGWCRRLGEVCQNLKGLPGSEISRYEP